MFEPEEAVARFFPVGTRYDQNQAKRLIDWLDSCGYRLVHKDQVAAIESLTLSAENLRALVPSAPRRKSA